MALRRSRWSVKSVVQLAVAPVLGLLILGNEAFIHQGEPRAFLILAGFGLIGLPFPLAADERRKGD